MIFLLFCAVLQLPREVLQLQREVLQSKDIQVQRKSQKTRSFLKTISQLVAMSALLCQEMHHFWPSTRKMATAQLLQELRVFPAATVALLLLVGMG